MSRRTRLSLAIRTGLDFFRRVRARATPRGLVGRASRPTAHASGTCSPIWFFGFIFLVIRGYAGMVKNHVCFLFLPQQRRLHWRATIASARPGKCVPTQIFCFMFSVARLAKLTFRLRRAGKAMFPYRLLSQVWPHAEDASGSDTPRCWAKLFSRRQSLLGGSAKHSIRSRASPQRTRLVASRLRNHI